MGRVHKLASWAQPRLLLLPRRQGVCALFNGIEEEVAACKAWIDAGSELPPPPPEQPLLRDPAGLDRHLNRRLEDTQRMVHSPLCPCFRSLGLLLPMCASLHFPADLDRRPAENR